MFDTRGVGRLAVLRFAGVSSVCIGGVQILRVAFIFIFECKRLLDLLLMEEILHHLGCKKPCK